MKKNAKKKLTYKENIQHFFRIYAVIPLIIITAMLLIVIIILPKWLTKSKASDNLKVLSQRVTSFHEEYEEFLSGFVRSPVVMDFIETQNNPQKVNESYYSFQKGEKVQCALHILDADKNLLLSSKHLEDQSVQYLRIMPSSRMENDLESTHFFYNVMRYKQPFPNSFTMARAVVDGGAVKGYVFLQVSNSSLGTYLQLDNNDIVLLTDSFDNIIYTNHSKPGIFGLKFRPVYKNRTTVDIDNSAFYCNNKVFLDPGLKLYTLNLVPEDTAIYFIVIGATVFMAFFVFIILNLLAKRMVAQNSRSIDNLIHYVKEMQGGNYELDFQLDDGDEFHTLAKQYKTLAEKLQLLIKNNEELSSLKRNSEIRLLEAQFNPHFILNALESLRYSLHLDIDASHEIITALSNQLKYSLYNFQEDTRLKDDLSYVDGYIRLHEIRFDSKIIYKREIDPGLLDAVVPKLVIQPLVENSIKYGFRYQDKLTITIKAYKDGENLFISVTDDGHGLKEDEYQEVMDMLQSDIPPDHHIGLYSINRRIALLYGDGYRIEIVNKEGESFSVIIKLPLIVN